jgi:hypothetical protein
MYFQVKQVDFRIQTRIKSSRLVDRKLAAAQVIYDATIVWYRVVQYENSVKRALEAALQRELAANKHNTEDDEFSKY